MTTPLVTMKWVRNGTAEYAWTYWHMYEVYKAFDGSGNYMAWCYVTDENGKMLHSVERFVAGSLTLAKVWCEVFDKYRQAHVLEKQQDRYRIYE
jgi:hypothetical protein